MKLAGEAVHAWKDWTQSWVLMPCAGVTQVKALSAGLLLSTVHCVCTWKVMNRIKTPFIYSLLIRLLETLLTLNYRN